MVMSFVICGDKSVGKTTLRNKFFELPFKSQYTDTIGVEFSIKEIIHQSGKYKGTITKAQFWDVNPQKRFIPNRQKIYEGIHVALLVYDVTIPKTLVNLTGWLHEIQEVTSNFRVVLIGNKIDLRETTPNPVSRSMGLEFAQKLKQAMIGEVYDVPFVELSAKTGQIVPSGGIRVTLLQYETSFMLFDTYSPYETKF